MFDAVLNRHARGPNRWGIGALAATALHVMALAGVIWGSVRVSKAVIQAPEVTFFAPPPPPPPPPPAGGGAVSKPKIEKPKLQPKKDTIVEAKKEEPIPEPPKTKTEDPPHTGGQEGGQQGGQVGGRVGGQIGGQVGGQVGGQLGGTGTGAVPFGEGMARPSPIGADEIQYTREAREAHVSGVMIVKCVITLEGTLTNCRVIKSVPLMDKPVLDALARHRGTPATFQGRPVSVDYTFTIRLKMPD
jgi:periplasmic protein TonB